MVLAECETLDLGLTVFDSLNAESVRSVLQQLPFSYPWGTDTRKKQTAQLISNLFQ